MNPKQDRKTTNAFVWNSAGRAARRAGEPLNACPDLRRHGFDTYGAWLMEQWRAGWTAQDEEIRQGELFEGKK